MYNPVTIDEEHILILNQGSYVTFDQILMLDANILNTYENFCSKTSLNTYALFVVFSTQILIFFCFFLFYEKKSNIYEKKTE